jgi:hypothetical protein
MSALTGRTRAGRIGRLASLSALLLAGTASSRPPSHLLKIFNTGEHTIIEAHISGVDRDTWGPDLLGDNTMIAPGESEQFTIVEGCAEDIKLVYKHTIVRISRNFDTCTYDLRSSY